MKTLFALLGGLFVSLISSGVVLLLILMAYLYFTG